MSRSHCPRFDQGFEVPFGSIGISKRGIRASVPAELRRTIPWAAIQSYALGAGALIVRAKSGEKFSVQTSRIPNLSVLLHALEQLAPRKRTHGGLSTEDQLAFTGCASKLLHANSGEGTHDAEDKYCLREN